VLPSQQTLAITHTLDTSMPMKINQSQHRPEMHTCYNCGDKGHCSHIFPKPQKQRIHSANSAKGDIKGIVAKAVAAVMDARELAKKDKKAKDSEKAKEDVQAGLW